MDVLEHLSTDQRTLIVSLPYRAGLWVSHSDDAGGDEADQKELVALSNIIHGFSEQVFGSELLQYVMNETVNRKDEWPQWAATLENVPEDCRRALDILRDHVDEKEVGAYAMRLMEIGEAVALAFREYEQKSVFDQVQVYVSYILAKLRARKQAKPAKTFDQFLNISTHERKALGALAEALDTSYSI